MSKTEEDEKAGGGEWKSRLKSLLNSGMHLLMYMTVYGLILFTAGLVCINGYHKKSSENNRRLAEIRQIKEENKSIMEENEELQRQIDYLKTPAGVESEARDKLGLVKKDEVAFVVVKDEKGKASADSAPSGSKDGKPDGKDIKDDKRKKNAELMKAESGDGDWASVIRSMWNDFFGRKDKEGMTDDK